MSRFKSEFASKEKDMELEALSKPRHDDSSYKYIYANSGIWVNQKKECTFVETQLKEAKHYVRVKQYTRAGTVELKWERYKELN